MKYSLVTIFLFVYAAGDKTQAITDDVDLYIKAMHEKHGDNFKGYTVEAQDIPLFTRT
uniref:Uncharacterized protein n=1 Tax=viral metagenome TaxID=1070528 RepID=A0A6M3LIX5_9ZZZZ